MRSPAALAAAVLLLLGACSSPAPKAEAAGAPAADDAKIETGFQAVLGRHGIDLRLPPSGKAIVVNIPAFELIAFENAEPVLRSRVIVGSRRNPTPRIDTRTTAVRFRPSWRPTPSMVASGEYADRRWPPGRKNPLGLAAIRLEPGLLIYLHDTNRRELFEKERRDLSHGCIRVERWDDLIAWLLDLDLRTVHRHANGRRTFDVPTASVPVLIRYYTAFPGDDGRLHEVEDIYGLKDPRKDLADAMPALPGRPPNACTAA